MGQALTNLLQNAADAIAGRREAEPGAPEGVIHVRLVEKGQGWRLEIADNGVGLPAEGRERLADPYVTTREKGTGLGLAIVRKIVEQHGGALALTDADGRAGCDGALAVLRLPRATGRPGAEAGGRHPGRGDEEEDGAATHAAPRNRDRRGQRPWPTS
jgi:two-component system nitrogen regulation sensor histidine kinase NtrY